MIVVVVVVSRYCPCYYGLEWSLIVFSLYNRRSIWYFVQLAQIHAVWDSRPLPGKDSTRRFFPNRLGPVRAHGVHPPVPRGGGRHRIHGQSNTQFLTETCFLSFLVSVCMCEQESSMDVESMILSQQQQQHSGDNSNTDLHNYQQALNGFEQVNRANWPLYIDAMFYVCMYVSVNFSCWILDGLRINLRTHRIKWW